MWFDAAAEVLEMFKSSFPFSFLFFVPIFILISPVSPANAAQEFTVFRMQQFDLQGSSYGCRNSLVNMEVRPMDAKMLTRRCVVAQLREVTMPKFRDLLTQNAGALLILLPEILSDLTDEEKKHLQSLERDLLSEETSLPVYFLYETPVLRDIYNDIQLGGSGDQAPTAWEALLGAATANGFQMYVNGPQAKSMPDFQIVTLQGHLSGKGIEEQLPTVIVAAHYDASGIAPGMSFGADSNGSGVIALIELARLFSKLYTNSRTHAKYNLVFLLTGAGKFNYQGTKKWIEDNFENQESSLMLDVAYVLCLDTIGSTDQLRLHVSKPPKEESAGGIFLKHLEEITKSHFPEVEFKLVHKKINLADEMLAWEHERFSIKRLPAFTLSRLDTHKSPERASILDTKEQVSLPKLRRNIQILAETMARHIYNLSTQGTFKLFTEGLEIIESSQTAWLEFLTNQSMAASLLPKTSPILATLEESMSHYLKDVKKTTLKADKRDPEFMFYDGAIYTMTSYNVKPAVFDLFLASGIAVYLAVIYLMAQNFYLVYGGLRKLMGPVKSKAS
ncbi:nicalin-1-like [Gigantopelta aegis]|uniref:nicalin-1-like n=1 Tax=Gigantopelta aegis TaxID=1735272 RepID=UPI001B8874F0|nr:nicalin-1-like [Gigantopelta aegis]